MNDADFKILQGAPPASLTQVEFTMECKLRQRALELALDTLRSSPAHANVDIVPVASKYLKFMKGDAE
jgi:hypothetical protein